MAKYKFKGYTISNCGYHQPDHCVWWEAVDDSGAACFHGQTLREVEFMILDSEWEAKLRDKDAEIAELREKWHEALNIADSVEKCASIERQTEAMLKKNEVICGLRKQIAELSECLRIIRDNLLSYTIKSEDGKYVNNGGFLSEEFVDDERWRKALEGGHDATK